jgi:hypothetical protein
LDFSSGREGRLDDEGVFGDDEELMIGEMDNMNLSGGYEDDGISCGELKCLQIDLRRFGLGKEVSITQLDFVCADYFCVR